ncbi:hypothetical protein ISP15_08025 [Dyella jejuensis]|uniref:ApeI dehydratase-like domain-containing protein n=1 Tax=Dyella jejuensis TaxID=1432009 RepID=A0ABW8JHI1_9GAMM
MNRDPITGIAERLCAHAWIDDARCGRDGAVIVLSQQGIDALCRLGRQPLLDGLHTYLADAGHHAASWRWRLLESLPAALCPDALLQAPLPRDALLLHEQQHEGAWNLALRVPLDLVYFPGHFPRAPVLPGVVQVAWALAFAAQRLDTPARCHIMEALKFQQLLRPGDRVDLALRYDAIRHTLHFAYRHGEKAYSSGRLAWSATA